MHVPYFVVGQFHDHPTDDVNHKRSYKPNTIVGSTRISRRAAPTKQIQHTRPLTNLVESKMAGSEKVDHVVTPPCVTAITAVMAKT